ncbi:MAG: hypothetical protein IH988_03635 [Planctomycetes bacterium]|nr:hypothetical protein [Planctomycetota bacterium]
MLKQLCNTREVKRIMWASADPRAAAIDGGLGHFDTRSHVMMLCNDFGVFKANVSALKTRAMVVHFKPSRTEILGKIKTFATDGEIVAFLDEFYREIPEFNLRTYRILEDLKAGGLDWRRYALDASSSPLKVKQIAQLLLRYPSDNERLQHYSASRRDFYNWKPQALDYLDRRRRSNGKASGMG